MDIKKLNLFIDFDDVIIKTRPRLEAQILRTYKCASFKYWQTQKTIVENDYQQKIAELREKEKALLTVTDRDVSLYLDELFEMEMDAYTEYVRMMEEIEENLNYIGINIDYILEILNNGSNYYDGDNPDSPYYIDYDKVLDMRYAIYNAIEFLREVIADPNIEPNIISHKNCSRESVRKIHIIENEIGDIPIHLLDFHSDPFSTGERTINSKAEYVMRLYGIDHLTEDYILIDDSKTNISDWIAHGGKGILYSPTICEEFPWQMQEITYEALCSCLNENQKKLLKRLG